MKRVIRLLLLLGLFLSGCSTPQEDLQKALLNDKDLPGWSTANLDVAEEPTAEELPQSGAFLCGELPTYPIELTAETQLQAGDLGPWLTETISVYQEGQGQEVLANILEVASSCDTWEMNTVEATQTWTASALPAPQIGDAAVAIRMQTSVGGFGELRFDNVYVLYGDTLISLSYITVSLEEPDPTTAPNFAALAYAKLVDTLK